MAYRHFMLVILAAIVFAATTPLSHAQGLAPVFLNVQGGICCTSNGSCPGSPIPGVNVRLNCTILGVSVNVGQGTTNSSGLFNIRVPGLVGLLGAAGAIPCTASVQLPLPAGVCTTLSGTSGILVSTITAVGGLVSDILGFLQNVILNGFVVQIL